jgi:ABC-type phosphate transport system substrate-binding protein
MKKLLLPLLLAASGLTHATVPVQNSLAPEIMQVEDLRFVFTLRIVKFSDGQQIKIFMLPQEHRVTREFATQFLGMTARRWWEVLEAQQAAGKINLHRIVPSEAAMMAAVTATPNSIGYLDEYIVINTGNNAALTVLERKPRR